MTFVYVASGRAAAKIGVSRDPVARIRYFARHEPSRGLTKLVKTWERPDDAYEVEYTASRMLVPASPSHGCEQFNVPVATLIRAVNEAIALVESGHGIERPSAKIKRLGWKIGSMRAELDELSKLDPKQLAQCRRWRKEGMSYREIQALCKSEWGIELSPQTVMVSLKRKKR